MSATQGWSLIATGAFLLIAGSTMVWPSSAPSLQRRARSHRPATNLTMPVACTSLGCGVITGVQWAVLNQTTPGATWVAVLSLPAFLAAAAVTRLLAISRSTQVRRQLRAIRRDRKCQR